MSRGRLGQPPGSSRGRSRSSTRTKTARTRSRSAETSSLGRRAPTRPKCCNEREDHARYQLPRSFASREPECGREGRGPQRRAVAGRDHVGACGFPRAGGEVRLGVRQRARHGLDRVLDRPADGADQGRGLLALGGGAVGPFTRYVSQDFTVTLDRQIGVNPLSQAGCVAYYDSWDFAATASGTTVPTWDDRSPVDRDLTEATNPPQVLFDDLGQPYVSFDGSNDELETVLTDIPGLGSGLAQTIIAVIRFKSNTGTDDAFQCGGTNGARLDYDGTNARGMAGADAASTPAAAVGAWAVYTITKDGTNVTVQKNLVAEVSTASAGAIPAGTRGLG